MKERVNWLISKLLSENCDGDIDPRENSSRRITSIHNRNVTHSSLVCVTQSSAKSYDEDTLTRKSVQKNILTRSTVIFQTQEITNENDVLHLYFQGRTYEHSIQNIIVPIVVRMLPRIWSLWYGKCWLWWTAQVYENVEIFPEQGKRYQMFRNGYEMSVVWWSNDKTDLRDSSGSWRWFSIDFRYFRKLKVSKITGQEDVVTNVRGKGEEDEEKMSSKTKSLSAWTKTSNPKLNWKKKCCLIVWSFARSLIWLYVFFCYVF